MRAGLVLVALGLLAVAPDAPPGHLGSMVATRARPAPPLDNAHHLYVLDGHGFVHPAGDAPPLTPSITWPNKDVAFSLALFPDGSGGYVLNGWGGLDPVGDAPPVDTGLGGLGFGVAREVALAPWASRFDPAGYVLDEYGGLHGFGDAPDVKRSAYFRTPIARGLVLVPGSNRHRVAGYTLDAAGDLYPFGGAPPAGATAVWPGGDVARGITLASTGGYVLDEYGALHPFGGAPLVAASPMWPGQDLADSVVSWSVAPAMSPGGWILDRHGGLHVYSSAPDVTSGAYWPAWDIARGLGSPGGGGGSRERTLVDPETLADAWGTYFNQRDARWGNKAVGATAYPVWEIGCLLTDLAMVYAHFGFHDVTPASVAANAGWLYLNGQMTDGALNVLGHPAIVDRSPSAAWIATQVAAGRPVIVGMNLPGGGTHFLVLTSANGAGDYWANDPWDQNGMHVQFSGDWDDRGAIYEAIAYP